MKSVGSRPSPLAAVLSCRRALRPSAARLCESAYSGLHCVVRKWNDSCGDGRPGLGPRFFGAIIIIGEIMRVIVRGILFCLFLPALAGCVGAAMEGANMAKDEAVFRNNIRSEEHTSELQSLMRISYAVFCLKK